MADPYAFVTLLTSDAYLPGALTLAAALKEVHPHPPVAPEVDFQTVCLVTPETVDVSSIKLLRRAFNVVIGVEIIEHENQRGLQLLGRPDLTTVLTKLHAFRLTQYMKVIFLDADVLPVRPLSHLFTLDHEFSAVPDVGWPDIFNSGLMALTPNEAHFTELMTLSKSQGSWDGGDQGLLNEWRGESWNRLSFTYNTTPTAVYTYAPAYERFGSKISAIHFIGPNKPWVNIPWRAPGSVEAQSGASDPLQAYNYSALVDRWYSVYDKHYRAAPAAVAEEYSARRYESAWDQETSLGAEVPAVSSPSRSPGTLSLSDLRRMAIEGFSGPSYAQHGEATYLRMPLEGRLDLMRPRVVQTTTSLESDGPTTPPADDHFFEDGAAPTTAWAPSQPQLSHLAGAHGYAALPGQPYDIAQGAPFGYTAGAAHDFPWSSDSHSETEGPPPHSYFRYPTHGAPHTPFSSQNKQQHNQRPSHSRRRSSVSHQTYPLQSSASEVEPDGSAWHAPPESSQGHRYGQSHEPPPPHGLFAQHENKHTRSQSPPMMLWNPAVEPPPNTTPTSTFPAETYFPNVWDQSSSNRDQPRPGNFFTPPPPTLLFEAPPPRQIPQRLLEEGHYAKVVGGAADDKSVPDPSRVKPIFPWEQSPRHVPARVFPNADAPPPGTFIQQPNHQHQTQWQQQQHEPLHSYQQQSHPYQQPPQHYQQLQQHQDQVQYQQRQYQHQPEGQQQLQPQQPRQQPQLHQFLQQWEPQTSSLDSPSSPTSQEIPTTPQQHSLPLSPPIRPLASTSFGYMNAWDTVPSIQKYASRLVRPPAPQPLQPAFDIPDTKKGRRRPYGDYESGNTSAEGDDEETDDEERDPVEREHDFRRRSRSGSVTKGKKEYRSQGVQTIHPEMRDAAVQVAIITAQTNADDPDKGPPTATLPNTGMRSRQTSFVGDSGSSTGLQGQIHGASRGKESPKTMSRSGSASPPTATHPRVRQAQMATSFVGQPHSPTPSPPGSASPRLPRSPRGSLVDVSRSFLDQAPRRSASKDITTPPPRVRPDLPAMTRSLSMGSDALSTPSTVGPPRSPEDEFTPLPQPRKGSRVWDPARGVDIFKKGSEEVLSRFLRMSSWEDEARRSAS